eukprot:1162006-Pelagomonas_calceolata.AAC.1
MFSQLYTYLQPVRARQRLRLGAGCVCAQPEVRACVIQCGPSQGLVLMPPMDVFAQMQTAYMDKWLKKGWGCLGVWVSTLIVSKQLPHRSEAWTCDAGTEIHEEA